ncbi:hypothetical protein [Sporosalibacterium faouarense]|nr:hypothetical protein [Sporosalibacterium faouarense]
MEVVIPIVISMAIGLLILVNPINEEDDEVYITNALRKKGDLNG